MLPASRPRTVLVVEDDPATRTLYRDALIHAGYIVAAVEDGLDALRRLDDTLPDAVVLDLLLPRVGGWDVYKELRSHPRTRRLPVVIVTGAEMRELEPTVNRQFLRKPITPDSLISAVERAIAVRQRTTADSEPEEQI